jgi:sugar transferase EpsL
MKAFYRRIGKRAFDVAVSATGLVALSPVMAIVALVVRGALGSPVLFRQKRPGLRGDPFFLCKFRTMTEAGDESGALLADEARLTAAGSFLRRWSLDELPELWNVLRGDMSLVGPRPLLMQYLARYTAQQARRHEVRPGITGWAQVNGRDHVTWPERFALDVWYVDRVSFSLDVKILALTLWKIVRREGILRAGRATKEEFLG